MPCVLLQASFPDKRIFLDNEDYAECKGERGEVVSLEKVQRTVHTGSYVHKPDDLSGNSCSYVGAENDAYRLMECQESGSDKAYGDDNCRCRALDYARYQHAEQETHDRLVCYLGQGSLHRPA